VETAIGSASHQLGEHIGGRGIPAAVKFRTACKKQRFSDVAFPRAGVPRDHEPLFAPYEIQFRDLHHLGLVHAGLEYEVEVCKQFSLGEFRVLYPSLYSSFDQGVGFYGKDPFKKLRRRQRLLCSL